MNGWNIVFGVGVLMAVTLVWFAFCYWCNPHVDEPDGGARLVGTCGDVMEIRLKFQADRVVQGSPWTNGCALSFNCVWAAVDLAKGKTAEEVLDIDDAMIRRAVGELPKEHWHCARLAAETLHAAVDNYMQVDQESFRRNIELSKKIEKLTDDIA